MLHSTCNADSTFADLNDTNIVFVKDGATASLKNCDFLRNGLHKDDGSSTPRSGIISVEAGFVHSTAVRVEQCKFEHIGTGFRFVKNVSEEANDGGYTGTSLPTITNMRITRLRRHAPFHSASVLDLTTDIQPCDSNLFKHKSDTNYKFLTDFLPPGLTAP